MTIVIRLFHLYLKICCFYLTTWKCIKYYHSCQRMGYETKKLVIDELNSYILKCFVYEARAQRIA